MAQVIWHFEVYLLGECQKLIKVVKIKIRQWIQKRPTTLNVLQDLGFITYVCFISIHAYSDHESPKKLRFALRKNLKLKIQNFVPQDPTKRNYTDTRDTSIVPHVLQISYVIHWACMQEKLAPMEGKTYKKIELNLKKSWESSHFFLINNTKEDAIKLQYHVSCTRLFQNSLFIDSNRLGLKTVVKNEQNSQITSFN